MSAMVSRLFTQPFVQAQIKKNSKLRATGLCWGIHRWPVNSPHKGPVARKMFPFHDVINNIRNLGVIAWTRNVCCLFLSVGIWFYLRWKMYHHMTNSYHWKHRTVIFISLATCRGIECCVTQRFTLVQRHAIWLFDLSFRHIPRRLEAPNIVPTQYYWSSYRDHEKITHVSFKK